MEDSKGKKKVSVRTEQHGDDIYHKVSGLPKLQELNAEVKKLVDSSSYWERYGLGLLDVGSAVPGHLVSGTRWCHRAMGYIICIYLLHSTLLTTA